MREFLKSVALFLVSNGSWIYYATMLTVFVIIASSAFIAHRKRGEYSSLRKEKPLSSLEYFMQASSRGEPADDEDYLRYREEFTTSQSLDDDSMTVLEYWAETYCPALIKGCVFSLILMAVVAAPYLAIEYLI